MIKEIESPVLIQSNDGSPNTINGFGDQGEILIQEDRITLVQYEAIAYRNPEIIGWMAIDMEKMHRNCDLM